MSKAFGYMGKILRIDMTSKTTTELKLDYDYLRKYFGGIAMSSRLLYDLVPPACDPLGDENKLILTTSPVTGTSAPGCSLVNVTTKSPLFDTATCAQMNGYLGRNIKLSGYDGIIIEGQSDTWQYVNIYDGKVEFCDASSLLGLGCFDTEKTLKERNNDPKASVFCIGQAGENLVKFAAVGADEGHYASTGGPGAVMGSKKLKAIIVNGTQKIDIYDRDKFKAALKPWLQSIEEFPGTTGLKHSGTLSTFAPQMSNYMVPVKNLQESEFEYANDFDGLAVHSNPNMKFTRQPCYACPIGHCNKVEFVDGKYKGEVGDECEYEGLANFGPNLMITDPEDTMHLNIANDNLGIDLKECGFLISWAMEAFQKNIISIEDTDGLELKWGDVKVVEELLYKIARREGKFANILAEGIYKASNYFGDESAKLAVYCKKHAPHAHDPRPGFMLVFNQCVTDMGSMQAGNPMTAEPYCGLNEGYSPRDPFGCGRGMAINSKRTMWRDSMLVCMFTERVANVEQLVEVANAVTGFEYTPFEAMTVGERTNHLLRTFNLLAGQTADDEVCSHRLMADSPAAGPMKGIALERVFYMMRIEYYSGHGWDPVNSKPLPETLQKVELDDLIVPLWGELNKAEEFDYDDDDFD